MLVRRRHGSRPDRFQNEISPTIELDPEPVRACPEWSRMGLAAPELNSPDGQPPRHALHHCRSSNDPFSISRSCCRGLPVARIWGQPSDPDGVVYFVKTRRQGEGKKTGHERVSSCLPLILPSSLSQVVPHIHLMLGKRFGKDMASSIVGYSDEEDEVVFRGV